MSAPDLARPLVPAFELKLDGRAVAADITAHVGSIQVDDDLRLPGMFAVQLLASDTTGTMPPWIDDEQRFAFGTRVELRLGYAGSLQNVFAGEIVALEPEFSAGHRPALTLRAYDARHRLQRGTRTRSFARLKDSEVAERIAREAGLAMRAEDSKVTHEYLVQANQSDFEFLSTRAQAIGYELRAEDGGLRFCARANDASEALTLRLGGELLELSIRASAAGLAGATELRGWNARDKEALRASARGGDEKTTMGGSAAAAKRSVRAFGGADDVLVSQPVASQAEADAMAGAHFRDAGLAFVRLEGRCLGHAELKAGTVLKLANVGKRFGGTCYVESVQHRFRAGGEFETRFVASRSAL